jgi:hypothetical protein
MDFDVLAGNLPANTSALDVSTELNRIQDLMQSQKSDWGVQYTGAATSPLTKKLASLEDLILFHVQFFGGAIEVIAREFRLESANKPMLPTLR